METIVLPKEPLHYSSILRRMAATFLDGVILLIPAGLLGGIFPVVGGLLAWFLYVPFFESSELRATIGKHLIGIQVLDLNGQRISFRTALLRSVLSLLSCGLMFVPHLLAFFTKNKQTAHDILTDTVVAYGHSNAAIGDAWIENARAVFRSEVRNNNSTNQDVKDKWSEIERIQALFERGALSKEEFEREKQKILEKS